MLHEIRFLPTFKFPQRMELPESSRVFGVDGDGQKIFLLVDHDATPEEFAILPTRIRYFYSRPVNSPENEGDKFLGYAEFKTTPRSRKIFPIYVFECVSTCEEAADTLTPA
jgi:hypothetical protein